MIHKVFVPEISGLYKFVLPYKINIDKLFGIYYYNTSLEQHLINMGVPVSNKEVSIQPDVVFKIERYLVNSKSVRVGIYKRYNCRQIGTFHFDIPLSVFNTLEIQEI